MTSIDSGARFVLRTSRTSPYGRKVRIVALRLGLADRIEIVEPAVLDPADPLRRDNPLGKMPCLVPAGGAPIYDSPVIVDYLDRTFGGGLMPQDAEARTNVRVEEALADGIADAAVSMGSERMFHPEEHVSQRWLDHQRGKVERGLAAFAQRPPSLEPARLGAIALACTLGYLDWRKPVDWRALQPVLVSWLDRFRSVVPEYDITAAT